MNHDVTRTLSDRRNSSHHATHRTTETVPHFIDRILFDAIEAVSGVRSTLERCDDFVAEIEKRIASFDDWNLISMRFDWNEFVT